MQDQRPLSRNGEPARSDAASAEPRAFLAASSTVPGAVELGDQASVWHGAVLRGDVDRISIGARSNIQDNATVHASAGFPAVIREGVSVGHNAVVHGCRIGDNALVGMGAVVLDGATVGRDCIVGAGALVTGGKHLPDRTVWVGNPARQVRAVSDDEVEANRRRAENYVRLARESRRDEPGLWR